jgi:hypothetical protein
MRAVVVVIDYLKRMQQPAGTQHATNTLTAECRTTTAAAGTALKPTPNVTEAAARSPVPL